jgi:phage RecT family recombinase
MNMGNQIQTTDESKQQLRTLLKRFEGKIISMVPKHVDGARLFEVYRTTAQTTPSLLECVPMSIIGSIVQAAQLGLSLDNVFGEAYLVPRYNKNQGAKVAQFQIGYKGLRKLALLADPELRDVYAREVYENDHFDYTLEPPEMKLRPAEDPSGRGRLKYAYAKGIWRDDYERFHVLTTVDIQKIKKASDAAQKGYGPWVDWEEAMWRKSALRAFLGTLTLSADTPLARAMGAEEITGADVADIESLGPVEDVPQIAAPKSALDAVADNAGEGDQTTLPGAEAPAKETKPKQQRRRRRDAASA